MRAAPTESISKQPTISELAAFMADIRLVHGLSPLLEGSADAARGGNELASIARRPPRGMEVLKFGSRSVVGSYRMKDGQAVVLKYYYPKSTIKCLTYGILGSRALQSWHAAHAFHFVGLPTPSPLYFSEHKSAWGLHLHMALLATGFAPGVPLSDWLAINHADVQRVGRVTDALRGTFATMARYRISHGDMKASNIIIDEQAGDAISFIDLDGARILSPSNRWQKLWNKDRGRFLANWKHSPEIAAMFENTCPPSVDAD